jgi:hypothetical protein
MGGSKGTGGAGAGGMTAAGAGGEVRRKLLSKNLKPGDTLFIANPDQRDVAAKRKALRAFIEKGGTPTAERLLGVSRLKATVAKKHKDGSYTLTIPGKSRKLMKKFFPARKLPRAKASRKARVFRDELKKAIVLRKNGRYEVK